MTSINFSKLLGIGAALLAATGIAAAANLTVLTVPIIDPNNPGVLTEPHTTYAINPTTEATIVLGATLPSAIGSSDNYTVVWNFGDGTSATTVSNTTVNPYDISTTHQYPASAGVNTTWTATVTVTDNTNPATGTAKYYVIQQANNLADRVNVAIDWGLWYMHISMWRGTDSNYANAPIGGWDFLSGAGSCPTINGINYADCQGYGSLDATNVQAFEVNYHYGSGPAADPFTDDVARTLSRMFTLLDTYPAGSTTYNYDPSAQNFTCKDGSVPTSSDPTCSTHGGKYLYNPNTTCTAPPCTFNYDGNGNGQAIRAYGKSAGQATYETGMFMDSLVASGTPNATAAIGPSGIAGETYKNIVQDMADSYGYCQYNGDYDVYNGYTRGGGYSGSGGGWLYGCPDIGNYGDDNSTSQWAAIGLYAARNGGGFNLNIGKQINDYNNVWVTNSQDVTDPAPTGPDPYNSGDDAGAFGYRGSLAYSNAWGPFAVTPSGMVQMAFDGVGRTTNTAFGDSTTAFDQRWNNAETFYADNFCNSSNNAGYAPKAYTYGLFSFTKSMLLHSPGGVLTPIQYLRTQTPGVFTTNTNPGVPKNSIDWYAALSSTNGGEDPCDGVAQTLIGRQAADGHWYGDYYSGGQAPYETGWSIIMLKRTVFVNCITNLSGRGTPAGISAARIDLTWAPQNGATSYEVLRGTATGGPYAPIGTASTNAYADQVGLTSGKTYYYVVQPIGSNSAVICQSNEGVVTIPNGRGAR